MTIRTLTHDGTGSPIGPCELAWCTMCDWLLLIWAWDDTLDQETPTPTLASRWHDEMVGRHADDKDA